MPCTELQVFASRCYHKPPEVGTDPSGPPRIAAGPEDSDFFPSFPAFWKFSVGHWENPALRSLLLEWQERYGADLNLVLFAAWYPADLSSDAWRVLHNASGIWQNNVVTRIRKIRKKARALSWPEGYAALLQLELRSEYYESQYLLYHAQRFPTGSGAEYFQLPAVHDIDAAIARTRFSRRLYYLYPRIPAQEVKEAERLLQTGVEDLSTLPARFHSIPPDQKEYSMKFETQAIHAGFQPDPTTKAVAVPIYQTTSYAFDDTQHGADLFDLKVAGNIYTRIMNPTTDVLEQRVAALEGGVGALAFASGMAAITASILTLAQAGNNIVTTSTLYGGTYNLFAHTLPRYGIDVRFADPRNIEAMRALIDAKTSALFCESIGNPAGNVADIAALAELAHHSGVPLIVDNTVPSPYLCRPFEHGADIVVHALTKYMGGHGTTIGGILVDSGNFPWADHAERFPGLTEPDQSYHGVTYTEAFGAAAYIGRARVVPLRNMGAAISPFNSFLILQGIETLPLRMDRHCENALAVAHFLQGHPAVSWVSYAGLPDHPDYPMVQRYLGGKASSILSFGVRSSAAGRIAGGQFIDALQLITRLVNIGDAKSLACHPATTTHRQLSAEELIQAGVREDMVRLSVGIEHIDDILSDLDQALGKVDSV